MAGWSNNQQNVVVILTENHNRLYNVGMTLILHTVLYKMKHKYNYY